MRFTWFITLGCSVVALSSCRGTTRCASDERFDENGVCVPVSSCPSGRDPATGVCTGGSDAGVDGSAMDADVSADAGGDAGPDASPCSEDCGSQYCDEMLGECVDCLDTSHCPPETPFCDDGNRAGPRGMCVGCMGDTECADRSDTPVCEESTGNCVPCTPDTELVTCELAGVSCLNNACNGFQFESIAVCVTCASDNECLRTFPFPNVEADCVELEVGQPGRVCAVNSDSYTAGGGSGQCPPGFRQLATRTSTAGDTVGSCLPATVTTCPAIRAALDNSPCAVDDDCGTADGQPDGICDLSGHCTVRCENDDGCPLGGTTCNTTASPPRCE